jgi:sirohydrochlorin cobaltochelatase
MCPIQTLSAPDDLRGQTGEPRKHLTANCGVSGLSSHEALLLVGHGSARYPDAGIAMHRHAEALRAGGQFGQVEVAVLNGAPSASDALAAIPQPIIRVVPFFMEEGYFSQVAVPRAIGAATSGDAERSRRVILCPPIGVHDGMAGIIERRALAACADSDAPSRTAAILVAGHGSASDPGRALALHRHAARVASTTLFARVEAACLEEAPFVADALHGLRAHPVVVIGFFANQGSHVRDDMPALIAAEQASRGGDGLLVRFDGSAIDDPAIVLIILAQATCVGD